MAKIQQVADKPVDEPVKEELPGGANVPAQVKEQPVAVVDDEFADAGQGMEAVSANDKIIPRLALLQDTSKATKKNRPEYIQGAKGGMFMDTAVQMLFDGETEGVLLIPCYYLKKHVEWAPRAEGEGGPPVFSDHPESIMAQTKKDPETGRNMLENGNNIVITPEHWCLQVRADGTFTPIVVSMPGKKASVSNRWNTLKASQMKQHPVSKQMVQMASFFGVYRMKTVATSNTKGDFFVPTIAFESETKALPGGDSLYNLARAFYNDAAAGRVRAAEESGDEGGSGEGSPDLKNAKMPF